MQSTDSETGSHLSDSTRQADGMDLRSDCTFCVVLSRSIPYSIGPVFACGTELITAKQKPNLLKANVNQYNLTLYSIDNRFNT